MIVKENYNIGHICTRQQCERGLGDKTAFRWISAHLEKVDYTFNDLDREIQWNSLMFFGNGVGSFL